MWRLPIPSGLYSRARDSISGKWANHRPNGVPAEDQARSAGERPALDCVHVRRPRIKNRTAEGLCVIGMRFTNDRAVPAPRFARLRQELGDAFIAVEIDSSPGSPHGIGPGAHSVVTEDLIDEPGHPTRMALDQVMAFFSERLKPGA